MPTPPSPTASDSGFVTIGRGDKCLTMTTEDYNEAVRYFTLFKEAIVAKYPHNSYSLGIHADSAQFVAKGCNAADTFKFPFDRHHIKNHYVCFLLVDTFENYLALARGQRGVDNHLNAVTPHSTGPVTLTYKK